ncbi:hypothetical protein BDV98DRAFT_507946 [Pterulicium gracile]|uniref:Mediator of RNA polymerase II transcription subunit 10 n=1 Tax=Pterulicium gracile TaxID=1884261 RepID=A0A5C3QLH2_9AGAR|nr:hypothetical protein BDV98DRAFT_507946 [Pterula gracilis]
MSSLPPFPPPLSIPTTSFNNPVSTATPAPAPDSPRPSESPPPPGEHGDIELELAGLANALYNLGTTVVNDSTKDKDKMPGGMKPVGARVNDVVEHLANLDQLARNIRTMIPMQVLSDIDNSRNPMQITKDRIERAATENQFMNAKISAIRSYGEILDDALCQHFPEIASHIRPSPEDQTQVQAQTEAGSSDPRATSAPEPAPASGASSNGVAS